MSIFKGIKAEQALWIGCTTLVFLYIVIRAIYNPLSHDEVATYFHFVQSGEYLPPQSGIIWDANNHLLNSFFTEIAYNLFGSSSFALRLPNVLSFLIYASSIAVLARSINNKVIRNLGFIASITVGYLVEYFALCRGYGLSMALFACALTYLFKYVSTQQNKHLITLLFVLFLACMANLTLINTYGLVLVLLLFLFALNYTSYSIKKRWYFVVIILLSIGLMLYPIYFSLQLKATGALYYGSKTGLWDVTGKTLTEQVFGTTHIVFGFLYLLLIFVAVFLFFRAPVSFKTKLKSPLFLTSYFILGNILAIYFLVFFLDVNFPEDRAAFYFIPLFLLLTLFVLDRLIKLSYLSAIFLFFPIYFLTQLNIQGSIFSADERVSDTLHSLILEDNLKHPTVGAYQTHILCYNYLEQRSGRKSNFAQPYKENDTLQDYLINKRALVDSVLIFPLYNLTYQNPETDVCLFKRKKRVQFDSGKSFKLKDSVVQSEYFNLIEDRISIKTRALKLNVDLTLLTQTPYFKGNLVFSGRDSLNNEIEYQYINIDWLYGRQSKEKKIDQRFVVNTKNMHHYILYLWNIDKAITSAKNIELFIEELN